VKLTTLTHVKMSWRHVEILYIILCIAREMDQNNMPQSNLQILQYTELEELEADCNISPKGEA
jgi:hypothetical protein